MIDPVFVFPKLLDVASIVRQAVMVAWRFLLSLVIVRLELSSTLERKAFRYLRDTWRLVHEQKGHPTYFEHRGGVSRYHRGSALFRRGWRMLYYRREFNDDVTRTREDTLLYFFRGTIDVVSLMAELYEYATVQRDRFSYATKTGHGNKDETVASTQNHSLPDENEYETVVSGPPQPVVPPRLSTLAIAPEIEASVEEARRWFRSGTWYRERGIPWTWGWLLHGPPGSGKSSLAVAMAEDLGIPVRAINLSTLGSYEMTQDWENATSSRTLTRSSVGEKTSPAPI